MYPSRYPAPYWYNYYYFYKFPTYYHCDECDEYDEDDRHRDDEIDEQIHSDKRQIPQGTGYTPGAPTQYPFGNLGHYGYSGETQQGVPGQMPQAVQPAEEIFKVIERGDSEIMRTLSLYNVPYETARQIIVRVIEMSLRYCR